MFVFNAQYTHIIKHLSRPQPCRPKPTQPTPTPGQKNGPSNHNAQHCGIHRKGSDTNRALQNITKHNFVGFGTILSSIVPKSHLWDTLSSICWPGITMVELLIQFLYQQLPCIIIGKVGPKLGFWPTPADPSRPQPTPGFWGPLTLGA